MSENVELTLDEAVQEMQGLLFGIEVQNQPQWDRYRTFTRQLNRALRNNALESEWSYYSSTEDAGTVAGGETIIQLRKAVRVRKQLDDSVRFVNEDGVILGWASILPRESLSKYRGRRGIWCSIVGGQRIEFSRPLPSAWAGLTVQVPVMREPNMFIIPRPVGGNPVDPISEAERAQLVDFDFPDIIVMRAAFQYAQGDPVLQPRVPTLEDQWKNMMYALKERDDSFTDSPYLNEFTVPIQSSIYDDGYGWNGPHPHSDERR